MSQQRDAVPPGAMDRDAEVMKREFETPRPARTATIIAMVALIIILVVYAAFWNPSPQRARVSEGTPAIPEQFRRP